MATRGRGIYVPIIGDPRLLFRALKSGRIAAIDFGIQTEKAGVAAANGMKKASVAADALSVDMRKISIAAEKSAAVQVKAEVARTARLKKEIVLFNEMAAAAKRGSREQILASNLAARAQRDLSYSLGITETESRKLQRSAGGANHELNRGFRGALAGSGIFRALGRSLAFASGGFLIFASASSFLRNSVDAARSAVKTQRSLAAQYRASGQSLRQYRGEIEDTVAKTGNLAGFTRDELTKAFVVAYRQVGNTGNALRVMKDAAEVARGRNLPLWTSVLGLTKAYGGQTTALRRLGILVPGHAKGMQVLQFVERKFAGQLKANTTAAERFHASLYNLEEVAGGAILPTVTHLQSVFAQWAGNTKNQAFVQGQLRDVLSGVGDAAKFLYTVTNSIASAVGGWKNAIVLIAGGWLGMKAAGVASAVAIRVSNLKAAYDTVAAWRAANAAQLESNAATDAAIVAENEAAATAASAAWRAALLSTGIGALAIAAGAAASLVFTHWSSVKSIFTGPDGLGNEVKRLTADFYDLARASGKAGDVAQAKLEAAQAKVNLDQARAAVLQARASEAAARGTKRHADAVDALKLAIQQLSIAEGDLTTAQAKIPTANAVQREALAKTVKDYMTTAERTFNTTATPNLSDSTVYHQAGQPFKAPDYVKLLQAEIDKGVTPQVFKILRGLQEVAQAYGRQPTKKQVTFVVTTVLHDTGKVMRLADLFTKKNSLTVRLLGPGLTLFGPRPRQTPAGIPVPAQFTPPQVKPIKDFQKWLDKSFALMAAIASSTTAAGDDINVARQEAQKIRAAIKSGRLHGDQLVAAYQELGALNATLAQNVKQAVDFGSRFDSHFALALAKASATAATGDDLAAARAARTWVQGQIASGKLGKQQLIDAYTKLADLNSQLAGAAQTAADKAKQARDDLRSKVDTALSQLGSLFQGPILAPSDQEIKKQLGVLPPTVGTIDKDLAAQNKETAAWLKDIQRLRKRGAPKQLIDELISEGPANADIVHQLATASRAQLQKYFKEFAKRVQIATQIATIKMTAKNVDLVAQNVTYKGTKQKGMQSGGPVPGHGRGDHVPALLEPRELVVSRNGLSRLGRLLGVAGTAEAVHAVATGRALGGRRMAAVALGGTGRIPSLRGAAPAGRVVLRANTVLLRADRVYLGAGRSRDTGGGERELVFKVDGDVFARASLGRQQRKAKRQVVQVRGRRGGEVLALG